MEARPNVVALAKQLQAGGMSLRKISAELAAQGRLVGNSYPLFTLLTFPNLHAVKNETDYPCCA